MNRSKNVACALIVFIILMVTLPLVLTVRVKEFDNLVKEKNEVIAELTNEKASLEEQIKQLQDNITNLEKEISQLNNDYVVVLRDYEELKQTLGEPAEEEQQEETENQVTIENKKKEELYAQKPETPTTQRAVEETTESVEEITKSTESFFIEETTDDTETTEAEQRTENGITLLYSETYPKTDGHLTKSNGVVYYNGHKETWYSIHEPGQTVTARDIPGKHIADDGTIRDADGYVCVASSDLSFYSVVMTTVGPGKVYDCGCSHGTIDVYTNW